MATLFGFIETDRKKKQGAALFGGSTLFGGQYDTASVQRQIDNASIRIQDAGYKVDNSDGRNGLERALNLPAGQNAFFDVLEVLQRPFQGIANVVDKSIYNGTQGVGEAFLRGVGGKDRVRGADLAENLDVKNPVGKAVLGTALEIGLDPLTYVPGGLIAKGVKTAAKPITATAKFAFDNARKIPIVQKGVEKVSPLVDSAKDKLGYMFNDDYKAKETLFGGESEFLTDTYRKTENNRRFMQEEYTNKLLQTAQKTGLEKGEDVGRLMEKDLRDFTEVKGYEFPDGMRRTTDRKELFNAAAANREQIRDVSKDIRTTNKEYQEAIGEFGSALEKTNAEIRRLFSQIERQAGKQLDASKRADLRDATKQLKTVDSQIETLPNAEKSLLRLYKKVVQQSHDARFDILKRIRKVAPNGIRAISGMELPNRLSGMVRLIGKSMDEVANELGYQYADDLVQEIKALDNIPRRLSPDQLETLARKEMERVGALDELSAMGNDLQAARATLQQVVAEISRHVPDVEAKAFADLASNPRWQELESQRKALRAQFDSLRGESKQVRADKLAQIKAIEDEIEALKEAAKNPVMMQKQIERPVRDMPTDPAVQQAAKTLMATNAEIRAFAEAEGIPIQEMEGYMTHVLSQAEREARKKNKVLNVDQGQFNTGNPNKKVVSERKIRGLSAEDVNEKLGKKFFEPNAYFATAIGQRRLIDYISAASFRKNVLSNPDFAMKLEDFKKTGEPLPSNSVIIDVNNYKFIKPGKDLDELEKAAELEIGGEYVVTKAVKEKLERYKYAMTDEGSQAFLRALDTAQSWWKRMALFSVPYHIRNDVGAKFNLWVGGMNARDIAQYSPQGYQEAFNAMVRGKESDLYREYRKQGLSSSSQSQVEFARYGQEPEEAIEKLVREGSKDMKGKVKDRLNPLRAFETSRELGDFIDQSNRFAMFKWAVEKKGMSHEKAAEMVREALFDYTKLTNFERQFMTRLMPFYRWMRNNLPFQVKKFIEDPRKYANLNKLRLNAQEAVGVEDEKVPDYMKESFSMPVWMDEEGKGKMLGFNLPLGDLTKLSNPMKMGVDALSPAIKLPIELSTNFNMFYRKPIEKFQGQEKQFTLFGQDLGGIPIKSAYAIEQATGQIGRGLSGYLTKPEDADQDTKFRMPSFGISSILKDFDVEAANYYEMRDKLKQLQDYINYIEQQEGVRPRSVNEIRQ